MIDFSKVKPTGIEVIDKCIMGTIYYHRTVTFKAIDTIYLNTYYWSQFLGFIEKQPREVVKAVTGMDITGEELVQYAKVIDFDGVKIRKYPLRTNKAMDIKFYPTGTAPEMTKIGQIEDLEIPIIKEKPVKEDIMDFDKHWEYKRDNL